MYIIFQEKNIRENLITDLKKIFSSYTQWFFPLQIHLRKAYEKVKRKKWPVSIPKAIFMNSSFFGNNSLREQLYWSLLQIPSWSFVTGGTIVVSLWNWMEVSINSGSTMQQGNAASPCISCSTVEWRQWELRETMWVKSLAYKHLFPPGCNLGKKAEASLSAHLLQAKCRCWSSLEVLCEQLLWMMML